MSKLTAESGERVVVGVPTRDPSNACVHIEDEDGRLLLSVRVATFSDDSSAGMITRMVVEGLPALMLQNASEIQVENQRVVFVRRQA